MEIRNGRDRHYTERSRSMVIHVDILPLVRVLKPDFQIQFHVDPREVPFLDRLGPGRGVLGKRLRDAPHGRLLPSSQDQQCAFFSIVRRSCRNAATASARSPRSRVESWWAISARRARIFVGWGKSSANGWFCPTRRSASPIQSDIRQLSAEAGQVQEADVGRSDGVGADDFRSVGCEHQLADR